MSLTKFFFFQAEDGIRDVAVTGVQTCALPIFGPGVYDIHSPRVPSTPEIVQALKRMREVLDDRQIWVNPDCGLKTRGWEETLPSLRNMVQAARQLRPAPAHAAADRM